MFHVLYFDLLQEHLEGGRASERACHKPVSRPPWPHLKHVFSLQMSPDGICTMQQERMSVATRFTEEALGNSFNDDLAGLQDGQRDALHCGGRP